MWNKNTLTLSRINNLLNSPMYQRSLLLLCFFIAQLTNSQDLESFNLSQEWINTIENLVPKNPNSITNTERRLMVFSLHTGFEHWATPHTEAVVNIIASKSQIATCFNTKDIENFKPEKLREFDAIVLNNTCPERDERDIFYDIFRKDSTLTEVERREKAA
ncbi:MAG: hypothetical protein RLZZ241_1104, partial [Bacteroidota bacterium]